MPASSAFLVSLQQDTSIADFVRLLLASFVAKPVIIARALRWIIAPWSTTSSDAEKSDIDKLTQTVWDLFILFPTIVAVPTSVASRVKETCALEVGISSKHLAGFASHNAQLLNPSAPSPPLTGALRDRRTALSTKNLELTQALYDWFSEPSTPRTAVSMLNLLAFHEDKLDTYKAYGRAFATDVGKRHGDVAKIVCTVLDVKEEGSHRGMKWDEIAVAHYPSVWHFADMASSVDYQRINHEYRIGALRGTAILCCDELDAEVRRGLDMAITMEAEVKSKI
ncbi:hypothetical protein S40285_10763 [Stachybotrys chlorohalonatus IBT 40285]|uniref:Uncharacterized protein n=1 Tax=Stachybotrys chlorohalonatus (strain IBT 40285) TaxID=1283841 RepID=A0A084R054_STAC4|nr:hypothetical protein S40285_10763 [Stachybotrys chlorohalonata IBT 40285]